MVVDGRQGAKRSSIDYVCEEREFQDSSEVDLDFEFDAPKFFDFTFQESPSHVEEAERWFLFAESYAPSHLIGHGSQKSKSKSALRPYLPKSSTLLKPTASHLAKLNQRRVLSARSTRRCQNLATPLNNSGDTVATKRQKLEIGYLKKAGHLKHQGSFAHKSSKKVVSNSSGSIASKPKVTIPKGPKLQINQRAWRYRSVKASCSGDTTKSKRCPPKAQPLNRKTLEAPLLPQSKKSTPCLSAFHGSLSIKRSPQRPKKPNSSISSEDSVYRLKSQPANRKLSVTSNRRYEREKQSVPAKKDLKENLPHSFPLNGIVRSNKSSKCNFKQNQCGKVMAVRDFRNHPTPTRGLPIY